MSGDTWIPIDEEYNEMCRLCENDDGNAFELKMLIDRARCSKPVCNETFCPTDSKNKKGKVPLVLAAYSGNAHIVKYLLTEFSNVIDVNCMGDIRLWGFYSMPDISYPKRSLRTGVSFLSYYLWNTIRVTALWAACCQGNLEIVKLLLRAGADVNATTMTAEVATVSSPMEIAAYKGHYEIMELLYSYGADTNLRNNYSPLMAASAANQVNAVLFLLEHGVDVTQKNSKGYSAFHVAVAHGSLGVICVLEEKGFLPNFGLPQLSTVPCPYFLAVHFGHHKTAKKLKEMHNYTKEYESESYLLIGAGYAMEKHAHGQFPMQSILDSWRKGVRLREECGYTPNFLPPSDVYAGLHEIITEDDLAGPSKDSGLDVDTWIRYQSLLIKERIMGPPCMLEALLNCGIVMCKKKMFKHAELLWLQLAEYYSMNRTEAFYHDNVPDFRLCMYEYAKGIHKMVWGHYQPDFSKFVQFCFKHLTKVHYTGVVRSILWIFVNWIQSDRSNGYDVCSDKCEEFGRKLVSQHFHYNDNITLLHFAVHNFKIDYQLRAHRLFGPYYQSLILALLNWGCDQGLLTVGGCDHPIHTAVSVGNKYNIDIVTPLLEYGCSPLFVNSQGQTALQLATSDMMLCVLRPYSLSLFDMCCVAMVRYRFPYELLELPSAVKNSIRLFDKNSRCNDL